MIACCIFTAWTTHGARRLTGVEPRSIALQERLETLRQQRKQIERDRLNMTTEERVNLTAAELSKVRQRSTPGQRTVGRTVASLGAYEDMPAAPHVARLALLRVGLSSAAASWSLERCCELVCRRLLAPLRHHTRSFRPCGSQSMWMGCNPGVTLDNTHRIRSTSSIDYEWRADEASSRSPNMFCRKHFVPSDSLPRAFSPTHSLVRIAQIEPIDKSNNRRRDEIVDFMEAMVKFKGMLKGGGAAGAPGKLA